MDSAVFFSIFILALLSAAACFTRSSYRVILILAIQATIVTMISVIYSLLEAALLWQPDAIIKLVTAIVEWFFAAIVTPLIIYFGAVKTKNIVDAPTIGYRKTGIVMVIIVIAQALVWYVIFPLMPSELIIFMPIALTLSIAFLLIATRDDPIKILVGLNIAETALFPFIQQTPILFVPPLLLLISFVNLVGVFIIYEAYREYGVLSVSEWRRMM